MEEVEEVEETGNTVQLVPDVILHMIEEYGFLDDIKSVLSFRLISKIWNESLRHLVGTKTVTILSDETLSGFEQLLSSYTSPELQVSDIRSVILNIRYGTDEYSRLKRSSSSDEVLLKKAMAAFVRLPVFFRSQLLCFQLNFEVYKPPDFAQVNRFLLESQLDSLTELEIIFKPKGYSVPVFQLPDSSESFVGIRFQFLQKLSVPLQVSVDFLRSCSLLKQLSLQAYDMKLPSDFWESFKNAVVSNGLNESIDQLFFVDKRGRGPKVKIEFAFQQLYECKFQLKKLGLGFSYISNMSNSQERHEIIQFLIQQSASVEYLQLLEATVRGYWELGSQDQSIFDDVRFPNLLEMKIHDFSTKSGELFSNCPNLEKIHLESMFRWGPLPAPSHFVALTIKSVVLKNLYLQYFQSETLFQFFPSLNSLEIEDQLSCPTFLAGIFTHGAAMKKLSIQVQFTILDERRLKRHNLNYEASYDESDDDGESRGHTRPIKADCFLLGQKPRHCKGFHSGQLVCDDTTEFRIPSQPSITNFHNLEYLSLSGYFTEMTLWAGIKRLTQLKELHLISQYLLHPRTLLKLESHLSQIQTWSYTKLGEMKYEYREMYKYFRILPDILNLTKIHVWKFNDDGVEKKVITLEEFDGLDLSYTGTRDYMLPTGFWPEPKSESELDEDAEISNSEAEDE